MFYVLYCYEGGFRVSAYTNRTDICMVFDWWGRSKIKIPTAVHFKTPFETIFDSLNAIDKYRCLMVNSRRIIEKDRVTRYCVTLLAMRALRAPYCHNFQRVSYLTRKEN